MRISSPSWTTSLWPKGPGGSWGTGSKGSSRGVIRGGKAMKIVASWLQERRTFEALEMAARCVALGGTREDLALLETSGLPADDPRVTSLLAATRFQVFRRSLS